MFLSFLVFFFKQKTAYEMRISDWSSDVCSSDLAAIVGMDIGKGRIECDLDTVGFHMRDQSVHALIGGLESKILGTCQTFGRRVDPHHPHRLEHVRPQELVEKIGADIARADDCAFDFGHFDASLTACSSRSANVTPATE